MRDFRSCALLCVLLPGIAALAPAAALPPAPPAADRCSEPTADTHADLPIVGTPWRLEDLDRKGIIDRSRITLEFGTDGSLGGHAGCNRYRGSYRLADGTLAIARELVSTRMGCVAESLMYQEQRFFELLPTMDAARVDGTGALQLSGPDGATLTLRLDEDALRERREAAASQP
jgi:putative lipoprotein